MIFLECLKVTVMRVAWLLLGNIGKCSQEMKGKTQSVYKRDEKLSKALLGLWTFSNSYTSESNDLLNQQSQKANSVCLEVNGISMEKDL